MAFTRKLQGETLPEKVVIVTGPTLGTILGFIALGAALGAAAALYFSKNQSGISGAAQVEEFSGESDGGHRLNSMVERLHKLQTRIKSLANRTRDTVASASEVLGPVLHDAVNEAKNAARHVEEDLQAELDRAEISTAKQEAVKAEGAGDPAI